MDQTGWLVPTILVGIIAFITTNIDNLLLLILLLMILFGALPVWPYSAGWGYYPSGGAGVLLLVLILLLLF